jgi:hypothetical protein
VFSAPSPLAAVAPSRSVSLSLTLTHTNGDAMKHAAKLPSRGASSSQHRLSHAIPKTPPRKIRIVHVLAPEVIKTEARDFRKVVQRLTGMPSSQKGSCAASALTDEDASPSSLSSWQPTAMSSYDTAGDEGLSPASGIKIEPMKVEAETSSGEGGGLLYDLDPDGYNDGFYDFLLSSCDTDGVAGFKL